MLRGPELVGPLDRPSHSVETGLPKDILLLQNERVKILVDSFKICCSSYILDNKKLKYAQKTR